MFDTRQCVFLISLKYSDELQYVTVSAPIKQIERYNVVISK